MLSTNFTITAACLPNEVGREMECLPVRDLIAKPINILILRDC